MDEQLDKAIDEVAREMTVAEPPARLRADVLARIERDRERGRLLVPRWAWAGMAAILVMAVGTAVWLTRPESAVERQASAAVTAPSAPPETVAPRTAEPAPVVPPATATAVSVHAAARSRAAQAGPVVQQFGLPDDVGPAPLEGPAAIDIAPLGPEAIAIPELGIDALEAIEPINLSSVGPGSPEPQRRESK